MRQEASKELRNAIDEGRKIWVFFPRRVFLYKHQ